MKTDLMTPKQPTASQVCVGGFVGTGGDPSACSVLTGSMHVAAFHLFLQ